MHRRYISNNKIAIKILFKVTFIIFFKENSFLLFLQEIVIKAGNGKTQTLHLKFNSESDDRERTF